jgi:hypothetical protein
MSTRKPCIKKKEFGLRGPQRVFWFERIDEESVIDSENLFSEFANDWSGAEEIYVHLYHSPNTTARPYRIPISSIETISPSMVEYKDGSAYLKRPTPVSKRKRVYAF